KMGADNIETMFVPCLFHNLYDFKTQSAPATPMQPQDALLMAQKMHLLSNSDSFKEFFMWMLSHFQDIVSVHPIPLPPILSQSTDVTISNVLIKLPSAADKRRAEKEVRDKLFAFPQPPEDELGFKNDF
ncbi:MAG: hypothetical protein EZS28_054149, partial [Streblomastix strix]